MRWRTNDMLADVATTYRNAVRDDRSPIDAVVERFGCTETAAKKRIARARAAGKLGQPGRVFDNACRAWSPVSEPDSARR